MIHKPVFDDDDDKPLVPLATVHVSLIDGVLTYSAVAHDWLSIHDPDAIGVALHDGADALHLLANSFGPAVEREDGEGADLLTLVPKGKEGDDDERPDGTG